MDEFKYLVDTLKGLSRFMRVYRIPDDVGGELLL